jgi:hypothetical protein
VARSNRFNKRKARPLLVGLLLGALMAIPSLSMGGRNLPEHMVIELVYVGDAVTDLVVLTLISIRAAAHFPWLIRLP